MKAKQEIQETFHTTWLKVLKEVVLVFSVFLAYRLIRGDLTAKESIAFQNGYNLIELEKHLRIFIELNVQSFFLKSSFLTHLVNAIYTYGYYPCLVSFGVWAYIRHQDEFPIVRNTFLFSMIPALLLFIFYPLAPPRFFTDLGFVDTMKMYSSLSYSAPSLQAICNPYAAMPSLHFSWTLLAGVSIICLTKRWWIKLLGGLLPTAMFISIVATGNHFVLDAIAGALTIFISWRMALSFRKLTNRVKLNRPLG